MRTLISFLAQLFAGAHATDYHRRPGEQPCLVYVGGHLVREI